MTDNVRRRLLGGAALGALAGNVPMVHAQAFPSKPLRVFVGYSAGGGVDAMARLLATGLAAQLGQQVVVENRAGASGLIAAEAVSKSPADGHTLMVGETGMLIASLLRAGKALDPLKVLVPVAGLFVSPLIIVAGNPVPMANPAEMVAELKRYPGRYSYATSGIGTVHHLGFELLKARTGTFVVHIPYRGAAQIVPDVIGGQVPLLWVSIPAAAGFVKNGQVKALAVSTVKRSAAFPNVPTVQESGVPDFEVDSWYAMFVPAKTPKPAIEKLNKALNTVLADAEVKEKLLQQGAEAVGGTPEALQRTVQAELGKWAKLVKDANIKAE